MTATNGAQSAHRQRNIILCVIAVALYWVALYLYRPTLATYVQSQVPNNLALVGAILSMYGLGQMIIRVPLGIASDWVGRRKPFIIGGLVLASVGAAIMGLWPTAAGLLGGHLVVGFAAGTWVPLIVLFSSLFPPKEAVRASALLTLVSSVSRMVATGVTGSLNARYGYAAPFMLAAIAAAAAVVAMLPSRETPNAPRPANLRSFWAILSRRDVLVPSLLSMVFMYCNWASTYGFVPIIAQELGGSDVTISLMLSMNLLITTLGNLFTGAAVVRFGERAMVYLTFISVGLGVAGAAWAPNLTWLFVSQLCIGLAHGVGYPALMGLSIRDVEETQRTTAMGLHQSIYAIGMFAGPALTGVLGAAIGLRATFYATATVALVLGILGTQYMRGGGAQHS
ncbi:MAG: MFS transporter [Anaerolineae bacterium]|jgi:MFS family permease